MFPVSQHFSFEFFPPRDAEAALKLRQAYQRLAPLQPEFFSVTFGAGGSTQDKTTETVLDIVAQTPIEAAPHLSCIGSQRGNIRAILDNYRSHGVKRIVALRGDMPSGMLSAGDFSYANELVAFIRAETGDHFRIEVAAYPEVHPQARDAATDLRNFKRKVDAGADEALTQYFYNADAYFDFVERARHIGIDIPIVPGIMPIGNFNQLRRFSENCGAEIPRWIQKRMESYGDDAGSIRAFGLEVVTQLCRRLLDGGAPGLHFYTMNQSETMLALWKNLELPVPA
ncbi:MAG: methylenetetrahydrofolate reductase [NAD(P)H] [Methylococcaceae bacterium]|nr:MAG: methylenetetrahydrofolate reductase [NAD(P)H] [Methylococcaceae bacterium]